MNIHFNKKTIDLYMILFFFIIVSGLLLFLSNNIIIHICSFIILVIGAASVVRFDIAHPYVWFSFIFMIYSISYPILYLNGITYDVYSYTKSLMVSQWLALLFFLLAVSPSTVDYSHLRKIETKVISNKIVYTVISIILILTIFELATGGYTHKKDIYTDSILASIGFRVALILLILYAINLTISALENDKLDLKQLAVTFVIMFLLVFFSGERDYLIRFFVITLFIYYIIIKRSRMTLGIVSIGLFSFASIPILAKYKYFGLTGETTTSELNFILYFLNSEFQSASKNLQIILLDESAKGLFNGMTFISAFVRSLYFDVFFGINTVSSGAWYNQTYFTEGRAGQGFTLVGDGYVNFGYFGIALLFIILGLIIKFIYNKSNKSIYSFVFYILTIPIFMYAIRADLANILSPLLKHNLLALLVLIIILEILYYSQNKKIKGGNF